MRWLPLLLAASSCATLPLPAVACGQVGPLSVHVEGNGAFDCSDALDRARDAYDDLRGHVGSLLTPWDVSFTMAYLCFTADGNLADGLTNIDSRSIRVRETSRWILRHELRHAYAQENGLPQPTE